MLCIHVVHTLGHRVTGRRVIGHRSQVTGRLGVFLVVLSRRVELMKTSFLAEVNLGPVHVCVHRVEYVRTYVRGVCLLCVHVHTFVCVCVCVDVHVCVLHMSQSSM